MFQAQTGRFAINVLEPFANVAQTDAVSLRPASSVMSNTSVLDHQQEAVCSEMSCDSNLTAFHLGRDAMPDRILHERLQDHRRNFQRAKRGIHVDRIHQALFKPGLLDFEIGSQEFQFVVQRDPLNART